MHPNHNLTCRKEYLQLVKAGYKYVDGTPLPQPIAKPHFSLSELKAAIPSHCFKRNMTKSLGYLAWNLFICSILFFGAYVILELHSLPLLITVPGYLAYWFLQGSYMTGLWVIAHECGHQAFSEFDMVNDIVGFILHSALFVPYHSWKITHRRHHSHTGSCENDEVFVPVSHSDMQANWSKSLQDSPIYNLCHIVGMLLFGWMPCYLIFNWSGPKKNASVPKSHFNPNSALFAQNDRLNIVFSDLGVAAALLTVAYFISTCGLSLVFKLYLVPYMIVNGYVVLITCAQHSDTYIPFYREGEWSWLRGTLCTVDRTLGKWLDCVVHHIIDTHVCHHIFPKIPFYAAEEATEAIKPILGDYYLRDTTPVFRGNF